MNIAQADYHGLPAVTEQMKGPHGIYFARVRYSEYHPGRWALGRFCRRREAENAPRELCNVGGGSRHRSTIQRLAARIRENTAAPASGCSTYGNGSQRRLAPTRQTIVVCDRDQPVATPGSVTLR